MKNKPSRKPACQLLHGGVLFGLLETQQHNTTVKECHLPEISHTIFSEILVACL
jgi:hypothetical protein